MAVLKIIFNNADVMDDFTSWLSDNGSGDFNDYLKSFHLDPVDFNFVDEENIEVE